MFNMTERSIRFAVRGEDGRTSDVWKCWMNMRSGKRDVYLTSRPLGHALKLSLHERGQWHVGFHAERRKTTYSLKARSHRIDSSGNGSIPCPSRSPSCLPRESCSLGLRPAFPTKKHHRTRFGFPQRWSNMLLMSLSFWSEVWRILTNNFRRTWS